MLYLNLYTVEELTFSGYWLDVVVVVVKYELSVSPNGYSQSKIMKQNGCGITQIYFAAYQPCVYIKEMYTL